MPKLNIRNSFSDSVTVFDHGDSTTLVIPSGEVKSLSEIVAMHSRGQDISLYARPVFYSMEEETIDHESIDFSEFGRMDFNEKQAFAFEHKVSLDALQRELKASLDKAAADKAAADAAAIAADKEELEKLRSVSKSRKYSKRDDSSNDD